MLALSLHYLQLEKMTLCSLIEPILVTSGHFTCSVGINCEDSVKQRAEEKLRVRTWKGNLQQITIVLNVS